MIDTGEVGPCWAVGAAEVEWVVPQEGSRYHCTSAAPWWTSRKNGEEKITLGFFLSFLFSFEFIP